MPIDRELRERHDAASRQHELATISHAEHGLEDSIDRIVVMSLFDLDEQQRLVSRNRRASTVEHPQLGPLDIDLDRAHRIECVGIERTDFNVDRFRILLALHQTRRAAREPAAHTRNSQRRARVAGAERGRVESYAAVGCGVCSEHFVTAGLRLERFDDRSSLAKRIRVDADVGADVDHMIAWRDRGAEEWQLALEQATPALIVIPRERLHAKRKQSTCSRCETHSRPSNSGLISRAEGCESSGMAATRSNIALKLADRWFGVPLLAAFAAQPKRPRPASEAIRRIGLLKTAAIGDTLLLAGLLNDVRRTFPAAKLLMITGNDNAAASRLLPAAADEQIIISPRSPASAIRSVRAARLDVIIDFGSWPRFDALLAAVSGARFRLGFRTSGQYRHFGYDVTVEHSDAVHERENYRRLLAALGVDATSPASITRPGVLPADRYPPRPYVVIHPWAGGYRHEVKEWQPAHWIELGRSLRARGFHIALSGGPSERDVAAELANAFQTASVEVMDMSGTLTLAELADVLVESETVVSVNTGIMHMAALLGARTVGLHGPTSALRWGPLGPRVRSVTSTMTGCPYLNLGFEYAGHRTDCMEGVSVDAVMAAVDELLSSSE